MPIVGSLTVRHARYQAAADFVESGDLRSSAARMRNVVTEMFRLQARSFSIHQLSAAIISGPNEDRRWFDARHGRLR
jgi:hypothetical protein